VHLDKQKSSWFTTVLRQHGINIEAVKSALPASIAEQLDYPHGIPPDDVNQLFIACAQQINDPHVGLHLAESTNLSDLGIYGYLLLNAGTIGDLLNFSQRYYLLIYGSMALQVSQHANTHRLTYLRSDIATTDQRHDTEYTLGVFANKIRSTLGSNWNPVRVTFQNPEPDNANELVRIFGPNISFNQANDSFDVETSVMGTPISDADPQLLRIAQEEADSLLAGLASEANVEAHIRLLIMKNIEHGGADSKTIASQMCMSRSTFKRRLANRNLKFRSMRDCVIREMSKRALAETSISVSTLAMQLGYSEGSAFNHAFKRLVGLTPKEYRSESRQPMLHPPAQRND